MIFLQPKAGKQGVSGQKGSLNEYTFIDYYWGADLLPVFTQIYTFMKFVCHERIFAQLSLKG